MLLQVNPRKIEESIHHLKNPNHINKIFYVLPEIWLPNTRVHNLISVSQIARLLLGDAIISSKTDPRNRIKKEKRSYGKVRNNKTMLKILSFIRILYRKQQSSILRCFCSLKIKKSLFSNKFFSFIFRSNMIAHTAKKDQVNNFAQK